MKTEEKMFDDVRELIVKHIPDLLPARLEGMTALLIELVRYGEALGIEAARDAVRNTPHNNIQTKVDALFDAMERIDALTADAPETEGGT